MASVPKRDERVRGFSRHDVHAFLVAHGLEQRRAGDGIRMNQRGAAQVDLGGQLLRGLNGTRFEFQCTQGLQPGHDAAQQQQG